VLKGERFALFIRFDLMQSSAAIFAMRESQSSLARCFPLILCTSSGIPNGWAPDRTGRGAFGTPAMGISRALLKVAQFGAQCLNQASFNSRFNLSTSTKTSKPRSKSQGSKTEKQQQGEEGKGGTTTSTLADPSPAAVTPFFL